MFKIVKWAADERADLDDMEQATGVLDLWESLRHNRILHMPEGRNTGTAATEARFLSGFDIDLVNSATIGGNGYCRLNQGSGFFKLTREGETKLGLLVGDEGLTSQVLDFATAGVPGTDYAVWIRAIYQDASNENRVFWNSGASSEYVDYVSTREEVAWEYDIRVWSAPSPGDDWVKAWKVPVVAGPAVGTVVDYRHFYFEGDAAGSYAHEWGTGTDRGALRSEYGVTDFHDFCSAMRKKMSEIQGTSWWTAPTVDLSDMAVEHKTTGLHSDVNADSVSAHKVTIAMTGVSPEGAMLDASGRWIGATGPLTLEDWDGNEQSFVLDTSGRPARGHAFVDDFITYKAWYAKATGVPDAWEVLTAGNGDAYCSVSAKYSYGALPTFAKHGGCAVLETTANGADGSQILGPNAHWLNASNGIYLRAFFRAALDNNGIATRTDSIGLQEVGGGKSFYFRRSTAIYGDANWRFYVYDGVSTQEIDMGVAQTAGYFQNFYIGFTSSTEVQARIPGMIGAATVAIASLYGAADMMRAFAYTENAGTATAHFFCIDHVEVWDKLAVHGGSGANAA